MKTLKEFIRWAKKTSSGRRLVCHFYIPESKVQYYDKSDYAYFNLFSTSRDWVVKGTPGHGIKSKREKRSPVPCLNCFEINDKFFKALKQLEDTNKFEFGIIFNKRKLKNRFDNVIDVSTEPPTKLPPPNRCHYFDRAGYRVGVLAPFNYCNVVRIEIPKSELGEPITDIPYQCIVGMLVKRKEHTAVVKLLKSKGMDKVKVFPLL